MDTKRSTSEWCVWGIQESEDRVRLVNLRLGQSRFIPVEQAAAAPDLLRALKDLHLWNAVVNCKVNPAVEETVQAAIAKAEGK